MMKLSTVMGLLSATLVGFADNTVGFHEIGGIHVDEGSAAILFR